MYTEEEAKTKWCPFVRLRARSGNVMSYFNRDVVDYTNNPGLNNVNIPVCAGSGCMAWRWYSGEMIVGYCGLAGKP